MNTKHIEHWYGTGSGRKSVQPGFVDGKAATFFALIMAGLIGASMLMVSTGEPALPEAGAPAASEAAPALTSALPEIAPNAVEQQPPSF
jgi:hypothetical protein